MEEIIAIYKGLRLPLLGMLLIFITAYVYWPSRRKQMEEPAERMLADDEKSKEFSENNVEGAQ